MKGLYDQIVEQLRDKTKPPFRCRSCGGEEFRLWEDVPYCHWIEVLDYDPTTGFDIDYVDGRSGDGGGDHYHEYWCSNCDDSASSLEELVGIVQPDDPGHFVVTFTSLMIEADSPSEAIDRAGEFKGGGHWEARRV